MLLEHLDLCGNVALPLRARNIPNPYELAYEALCLVGLQDFAHYFPDEISGGMKKRVTFARALTLDPISLFLMSHLIIWIKSQDKNYGNSFFHISLPWHSRLDYYPLP